MSKRRALLAFVMVLLFAAVAFPVRAVEGEPLDALIAALAPEPANEALSAIEDPGRKLLALRSYIRAGSKLAERWSWTDAEIKAFEGSPQQQALLDAVAAVSAHFAEANPGHAIYANTKVRSLDVQIRNWNSNESVGAAAAEILDAWRQAFGADAAAYPSLPPEKVRAWLSGFTSTKRAGLAAPGLTEHGQALAIDFQVMKDGAIIAGADMKLIETVWRAQGWDVKLKESMTAAGPAFSGPLVSPDEPWHYRYDPKALAAGAKAGGD
jgi:hypothetical protein